MAQDDRKKPGFFRRMFGRGDSTPEATQPSVAGVLDSQNAASQQDFAPTADAGPPIDVVGEGQALLVEGLEPSSRTPEAAAGDVRSAALIAEASNPEASSFTPDHPSSAARGEALESRVVAPKNWWNRLRSGLSRSSSSITQGIADVFTKRKLDAASLEDLEDILVRADLGLAASDRIVKAVAKGRYEKEIAPEEVRAILAAEVERSLNAVAKPFVVDPAIKPFVVLVVGVNGSGKTTTIAKLTAKLRSENKSVLLAAGDTFRAAAIAQLKVWGDRLGAPVVAREPGADAAGLAFDALSEAKVGNVDVVLMDTAGRLQNRKELMDELEKIVRVMKKVDASAPHAVLLVLDATVGQNALSQVEIFGRVAGVTGLVMTKLDGTARGGILVAIADKFGLPIHFIGVGETADDLEPFEARDFAQAIAGLDRK